MCMCMYMCMLHLPPSKRGTRDEATLKLGFPKAQSHLHLITTHFRGGGGKLGEGGEAREGGGSSRRGGSSGRGGSLGRGEAR